MPVPARVALHLVGWLLLVIGLVALAAHQFAFTNQQVIVLASVAPYVLTAALLALVPFVAVRSIVGIVAATLVSGLVLATQLPLYLPHNGRGPVTFTLLQANLRLGEADASHLVAEVRHDRVDVLTTVELTPAERDRLTADGLSRELPYRYDRSRSGGEGLAIWSRYPLTGEQAYPGFELGLVTARLSLPGGAITVAAVHVTPPWPGAPREWKAELSRLKAQLAELSGPVVLGGDFNATPDHAQFRALLTGGYANAGQGYLATYPGDRWYPPLLAIDHVLLKSAKSVLARTVPLPGSDHRGLLVGVRVG